MCDTPKSLFSGTSPCGTCPYRKDVQLTKWHISEFTNLLFNDHPFGAVYNCHKNDGSVCRGWLIDQFNNDLPNIKLRIMLSTYNVERSYLESLHSEKPMFKTLSEMCYKNYPELKKLKIEKNLMPDDIIDAYCVRIEKHFQIGHTSKSKVMLDEIQRIKFINGNKIPTKIKNLIKKLSSNKNK